MDKMIAYCGLVCTECPAYVATQANDQEALAKVAAEWREQFDPNITVDTIACDGCLAESERLCSYCSACPMRLCGVERGVANCAVCPDYVHDGVYCDKVATFFEHAPDMQAVLDGLHQAAL
jgi:hypothetical protein